ncbi:hypothetical protein CH063_07664 [Colletotrichum higginsianum]|uniref:EC39 protein n=2 Tax=Colletotrichum higginsianum TaxID=80884 RepID=H1V6Z3_COLHI|nr:EC39 protein [Colletotrichum higginsianum IMI 349063]OBR09930.1 EC39 protein [Colletotrichum higginsianum IMI 349063]TID06735.1 hypothetical protein CH35J_001486 [Colletotrichum higginsianum]CCF35995.1 hypothetical protein CH063_07664 [Colletotrichum higginsianum]
MKSLNAILVFASLAAAAPAASADAAAPIEARQAASPCRYEQKLTWNTGQIAGDGGWACITNNNGGCREYYWKDEFPYFSCA